MMIFTIPGGRSISRSTIEALSSSQLAELYNEAAKVINEKTVIRFSDKTTALRRTLKLLDMLPKGVAQEVAPAAEEAVADVVGVAVEATDAEQPSEVAEEAQEPVAEAPALEAAPKAPKASKAPKEPKAPAERQTRKPVFNFPKTDNKKSIREGTKRRVLYDLLTQEDGATFEECLAATWGDDPNMTEEVKRRTCYEGIRLLHYYCGYGMTHNLETGKIKIK